MDDSEAEKARWMEKMRGTGYGVTGAYEMMYKTDFTKWLRSGQTFSTGNDAVAYARKNIPKDAVIIGVRDTSTDYIFWQMETGGGGTTRGKESYPVAPDLPTTTGCFIATASMSNTPFEKDINALRNFRDQSLPDPMVSLYYKHSPKVADRIRESEVLKGVTRALLRPLVFITKRVYGTNRPKGDN